MRQTKKIIWKIKKTCVITITFHLHPNMHLLSVNTLKHEEFLDATQLMLNVTIDYHSIAQEPCDQFMEETQDEAVEDIGDPHELFQFLGRVNSHLSTFVNFEKIQNL